MGIPKDDLPIERLRELLRYDPETGLFFWLPKLGNSRWAKLYEGRVAGRIGGRYVAIQIDRSIYKAHRLAWLYMTGAWPEQHIDHINGDDRDTRWCNLRAATASQNAANCHLYSNNRSRLKGAYFHKGAGRFTAQIRKDYRLISLGYFDTAEAAHAAYVAAAQRLHGEFARAA